jgi:hypothetical protein
MLILIKPALPRKRDLTVVQYSETNNGLPSKSQFRLYINLAKANHKRESMCNVFALMFKRMFSMCITPYIHQRHLKFHLSPFFLFILKFYFRYFIIIFY